MLTLEDRYGVSLSVSMLSFYCVPKIVPVYRCVCLIKLKSEIPIGS